MIDLGFQSGDYVRCVHQSFPDKVPEAQLICPMRTDQLGQMTWWASNCNYRLYEHEVFPIVTVSCGPRAWVLNESRTVWRDGKAFVWDELAKTWIEGK